MNKKTTQKVLSLSPSLLSLPPFCAMRSTDAQILSAATSSEIKYAIPGPQSRGSFVENPEKSVKLAFSQQQKQVFGEFISVLEG